MGREQALRKCPQWVESRQNSVFRSVDFSLANDVGSPALDAALAVVDRESIRLFEAVNFVDGNPLIVLYDLSIASDDLTGAPGLTDCTCKIAEA